MVETRINKRRFIIISHVAHAGVKTTLPLIPVMRMFLPCPTKRHRQHVPHALNDIANHGVLRVSMLNRVQRVLCLLQSDRIYVVLDIDKEAERHGIDT